MSFEFRCSYSVLKIMAHKNGYRFIPYAWTEMPTAPIRLSHQ